jgi:hypothetical protein
LKFSSVPKSGTTVRLTLPCVLEDEK